ncbi:MAG: hypothetical protein K6T28_00165 [Acidothermus sp.]|nr:hypothetical protein [Acidothermus sp.]
MSSTVLEYESYEFDPRYYIHTPKNNITSFGHVIAEAVSNADEAITRRAIRDREPDAGRIHIRYDPGLMELTVTDDGDGLVTEEVRKRLKRVGAETEPGAKRAFFHRGIREAFNAMGVSTVETVALKDGVAVYTKAIFHPTDGMAIVKSDTPVTDALRKEIGITSRTGTRVAIPLRPLAATKPHQFTFPKLMEQIENSVQVRPVLMDPNRDVVFEFGDALPRRVRFSSPKGEELIAEKKVEIADFVGSIWARAAKEPIKGGGLSRQTRRFGILIRGERAAYEVSLGTKLQTYPAHRQLFGELRIDGIEQAQREADEQADEEAQLIYEADRSGLNPDHPLVEAIYQFLDAELGSVLAALEAKERKKKLSTDMGRHLLDLARLINEAVKLEDFGDIEAPEGRPTKEAEPKGEEPIPPEPPTEMPIPPVEDGIAFAYNRIFVGAGKTRTIKVWFDTAKIPVGTTVELEADRSGVLRGVRLSAFEVPEPPTHGIGELLLTIQADEAEGREEVTVRAGGYFVMLPVYVRFPRATGFIRDIVPVDEDWESGAALYDPQTGRVKVYVGRPEFVDVAKRASKDKIQDPFDYLPYRMLVVESVREAALRTAAERRAEVLFDELAYEERQEQDALSRLALTEYQALDYKLRRPLVDSFVYG